MRRISTFVGELSRRLIVLGVAGWTLVSCAEMIAPKPDEVASANYGAYPNDYREIVNLWMRDAFFDPYSVRDLEITPPEKWFFQAAPLMGGGRTFGYRVRVSANAKNRMGGYTGRQTTNLLIRDGKIIKQWQEGELVL